MSGKCLAFWAPQSNSSYAHEAIPSVSTAQRSFPDTERRFEHPLTPFLDGNVDPKRYERSVATFSAPAEYLACGLHHREPIPGRA